MTYIYDILLNFNDELFEYFQWEDSDNIKYVKKIALFKVDSKVMREIINNEILFDSLFTENIPKYEMNDFETSSNLCLLTDGLMVIGVLIRDNKVISVSRLLLDEELEALENSEGLEMIEPVYTIIKTKKNRNLYLTRKEREIKSKLETAIDDLFNSGKLDELKYFYYEFTGKESSNMDYIYKYLKESLEQFNDKHLELFEILMLSNVKNE